MSTTRIPSPKTLTQMAVSQMVFADLILRAAAIREASFQPNAEPGQEYAKSYENAAYDACVELAPGYATGKFQHHMLIGTMLRNSWNDVLHSATDILNGLPTGVEPTVVRAKLARRVVAPAPSGLPPIDGLSVLG